MNSGKSGIWFEFEKGAYEDFKGKKLCIFCGELVPTPNPIYPTFFEIN